MTRAYLGQNFLTDEAWQQKIVDSFHPKGPFGEIGPGRGELTRRLSQKFSNFVVFEKDPKLVSEFHSDPANKYRVIKGDFLDWDFCLDGERVKNFSFIGNLPYESGSMILIRIVENADAVDEFFFMLQKEVVERICARPHTRDFSSFTVMVQGQFEVTPLEIVPPEAFRPAPKVYSQLVRGQKRKIPHPTDRAYQKFLKASFLQKRKTLRNTLKSLYSETKMQEVFQKFGLDSLSRAEEIEVDLWPKLFEEFSRDG